MRKTVGLLLVLMLAWGITGCGKKQETAKPESAAGGAATTPATAMAKDPVCGMDVKTADAPKAEFKSKTYYFCSEGDKATFTADPTKYVKPGE